MQYNGLGSTPALATLATLRDSYSALVWSGPHVHSSVYVTLDTLIPPPASAAQTALTAQVGLSHGCCIDPPEETIVTIV